jgi:hypothetical protein
MKRVRGKHNTCTRCASAPILDPVALPGSEPIFFGSPGSQRNA